MQNVIALFLFAGLIAVAGSLILGLFFLSRKDEQSRRRSNQMMRFRIAAQFFTIAMLVVLLVLKVFQGQG